MRTKHPEDRYPRKACMTDDVGDDQHDCPWAVVRDSTGRRSPVAADQEAADESRRAMSRGDRLSVKRLRQLDEQGGQGELRRDPSERPTKTSTRDGAEPR